LSFWGSKRKIFSLSFMLYLPPRHMASEEQSARR
jgi:hypothetical protein